MEDLKPLRILKSPERDSTEFMFLCDHQRGFCNASCTLFTEKEMELFNKEINYYKRKEN